MPSTVEERQESHQSTNQSINQPTNQPIDRAVNESANELIDHASDRTHQSSNTSSNHQCHGRAIACARWRAQHTATETEQADMQAWARQQERGRQICRQYTRGECHRGSACHYLHPGASGNRPRSVVDNRPAWVVRAEHEQSGKGGGKKEAMLDGALRAGRPSKAGRPSSRQHST